jgi:hypothetical protein
MLCIFYIVDKNVKIGNKILNLKFVNPSIELKVEKSTSRLGLKCANIFLIKISQSLTTTECDSFLRLNKW